MVQEAGHDTVVATQEPERSSGVSPLAAATRPLDLWRHSVLSLQRAAGNHATSDWLRIASPPPTIAPSIAPRDLARCAGGCTCGGTCRQNAGLEEEASEQMRRAVARRLAEPQRLSRRSDGRIILAEVPIGSTVRGHLPESDRVLLQRDDVPAPAGAASTSAEPTQAPACDPSVTDCSARPMPKRVDNRSVAPAPVNASDARAIVSDFVSAFAGLDGAVLKPFPDAVASSDTPRSSSDPSLLTWPKNRMLARAGLDYHFEGGFVGSVQLCYDLCTAEIGLVGWVWAGGGVEADYGLFGGKQWWGAYVFAEKDFGKSKVDLIPKLPCGTCDPRCSSGESDHVDWGGGFAGFPVVLKPGEKKSLKAAGIEVGALYTPRSNCDADLEIIALIDLTEYIPPPYGPGIRYAMDLLTKWGKKINLNVECGAGLDLSGSVHLCQSVPGGGIGGITADSARICLGGYIGCNVGLPHEKTALPGVSKH